MFTNTHTHTRYEEAAPADGAFLRRVNVNRPLSPSRELQIPVRSCTWNTGRGDVTRFDGREEKGKGVCVSPDQQIARCHWNLSAGITTADMLMSSTPTAEIVHSHRNNILPHTHSHMTPLPSHLLCGNLKPGGLELHKKVALAGGIALLVDKHEGGALTAQLWYMDVGVGGNTMQ